eukprot:SAG22_NODE_67_length_22882_cov_25.671553_3_plen_267_part_00
MRLLLLPLAAVSSGAATADGSLPAETEWPRADGSSGLGDRTPAPAACTAKLLGHNLDAPAHDLPVPSGQQQVPDSAACGAACCANPKCGGALFEPRSAVTYGGCKTGKPCCFMKATVADHKPMAKPVPGGSDMYIIPGRSQDDEKLNFLSATLGSHMVLQRAPQQAVVWGHTEPGAKVTTTMSTMASARQEEVAPSLVATAGADGTWRQLLPATKASKTAYTLTFASSSSAAEKATMTDVLFGDVFLCGGQVNPRTHSVCDMLLVC